MSGSFVVAGRLVAGLRLVGLLEGTACFLAGKVGSAWTPLVSWFFGACSLSVACFLVGWAGGAAGKEMYAGAESSDPSDPPSPSPLNALTVNPTFCPVALAGTASTALHDEPAHAPSAGSLPTTPDWVLETSYD